jgi:drug/metabolite transporter (DMT)-like permease
MTSGVAFGVLTAVSWGSADFLARFATRALGPLRAVFWMQTLGALFISILLFFSRAWGHLFDGSGWQPWLWGVLAGAINTFAMLALYRAFEIGKLALVGPVSASYPALTVVLALLSGERLSALRNLGILAAIAGVLLVAVGETQSSAESSASSRASGEVNRACAAPQNASTTFACAPAGLLWAIVASLSFGFLFWVLGIRIIPRTGAIATVWLIRISGAIITLPMIVAARLPLRIKKRQTAGQVYGMGFLDTAAFALSNLGMRFEQVAIISVLGSLYGAVTVALAALFLRERIAARQWLGIASIFIGVIFINL